MPYYRTIAAAVLLVAAGGAQAQVPAHNISPALHPNLAAAQDLADQAFNRLSDAERSNEFDLGGHAARAKALLAKATYEMKAAALAANRR